MAFDEFPSELKGQIDNIINKLPEAKHVFEKVVEYYSTVCEDNKRRKISGANGANGENGENSENSKNGKNGVKIEANENKYDNSDLQSDILRSCVMLNDVSMLLPERKKGNLLLTKRHVVVAYQTIPDIVPVFNIERKHIKVCMILHVPDKAKPQWNVILCGVKPNNDVSSLEPLIQFTIQDLPGSKICNSISRIAMGYTSELELSSRELMNEVFKFVPIVESDSGKGFCVSAHRGSKEGLIYFLDGWVFFGFKKPMVLIPVDRIESVSYSAITRVTFDLTIKQFEGQELELSMIDQGDYDLINDYVIANQLNNQSMSEARRAKQQSGVTVRSSSDLPDIKTNSELNLASGQEGDFKEKIEQDADEDEEEDDESYEIASDHDSDSEEDSENSEDSEASEEGEDFEEDSE